MLRTEQGAPLLNSRTDRELAPVNGVQFWCWSSLAAENCQRNKYLGIKEALQILIFAEFLKSLEIDLAVTRLGIA